MKAMLAKSYQNQPVTGWLMSEKLDGVRAIWDGTQLISRNGNKFFAPEWFTNQLPAGVCLDGELYIGRGLFQKTVGAVRKKSPIDVEWQTIRYCVFDAPECEDGFESRIDFCAEILAGCEIAEAVEQTVCKSNAHLQDFFAAMVAQSAEGVMLRRPGSYYEQRRSASLLKLKPLGTDEAEVVGHQAGEGKHFNRLGSLVCRWGTVIFNLGTGFSDANRETPPQIGAQVEFSYQGLTDDGVPRFPVFLAERNYE